MNHPQFNSGTPSTSADARHWHPGPGPTVSGADQPSAQDHAFIALQNAYRPYAGLMRLRRLAGCGQARTDRLEGEVQHLLEAGQLFGFAWYDAVWIPLFQLDLPWPTVASAPQRVLAQWGREVDGWALAHWFVQPHARLASRSPIDCLGADLPEVLAAAFADGGTCADSRG